MNLFRSEAHARRWTGFRPEAEGGLVTLDQITAIMSTPRHADRLNPEYVSAFPGYAQPFFDRLREVTGNHPFWDPTPH